MNVTRASRIVFAVVALSFIAGTASADPQWPLNNLKYKCTWVVDPTKGYPAGTGTVTRGDSVITFLNLVDVPGFDKKTGTLRTYYPATGATVDKAVSIEWLWSTWNDQIFELVTTGGPTCTLTTYQGQPGANQGAVRFDGQFNTNYSPHCSNGAFQNCTRTTIDSP